MLQSGSEAILTLPRSKAMLTLSLPKAMTLPLPILRLRLPHPLRLKLLTKKVKQSLTNFRNLRYQKLQKRRI